MIIDSTIWGPHGWKFIHMVALAYPLNPTNEQKKNYSVFFSNIGNILPCVICSNHYNENLKKYPLNDTVLKNKTNLLNWTIDMHNEVNKMNNSKVYSYDEALKLIRNNFIDPDKQDNNDNNNNNNDNNNNNNDNNKELSDETNIKKDTYFGHYLFTLFFLILIFLLFVFFLSTK
jgi:hypothetical protein